MTARLTAATEESSSPARTPRLSVGPGRAGTADSGSITRRRLASSAQPATIPHKPNPAQGAVSASAVRACRHPVGAAGRRTAAGGASSREASAQHLNQLGDVLVLFSSEKTKRCHVFAHARTHAVLMMPSLGKGETLGANGLARDRCARAGASREVEKKLRDAPIASRISHTQPSSAKRRRG
jgi:hypothetical protein